jgi:flagellar assembly protein FliH
VEHSAPVSHELPVLESGSTSRQAFGADQAEPLHEEFRGAMADPEQAALTAYRHGVEEGIAQGIRRAEAASAARKERDHASAAALAGAMQEQLARYAERLEREAFRFALAVAGKILRREISLDGEAVLRQVKDAFHRVVGAETVTLRVHPEDEPMLRERKNEMLAAGEGVREVLIEPDVTVERGGCIIESPSGNIDARVSTQLAQIDSALFGTTGTARNNG